MSTKKVFFVISVFISILFFLIWSKIKTPVLNNLKSCDFFSYYTGSYAIRVGRVKDIYNIDKQIGIKNNLLEDTNNWVLPYRAPVSTGLFYYPYTFLNPRLAYNVFFLIQVILLLVCSYLILNKLNTSILVVLLFSISPPIIGGMIQGQLSILLTVVCLLSITLFEKNRYYLSGLMLSFILLKPNLSLVIFLSLILARNTKYFLGVLTGSLSIFLVNLIIYGKYFISDYLKFLLLTEKPYYGSHIGASYTIKTLVEATKTVSGYDFSAYLLPFTILMVITISILLFIKRDRIYSSYKERLGLAILLGVPLGLHVNTYDLSILIIPISILVVKKIPVWWKLFMGFYFIIATILNFRVLLTITITGIFIISINTIIYINKVISLKANKVLNN